MMSENEENWCLRIVAKSCHDGKKLDTSLEFANHLSDEVLSGNFGPTGDAYDCEHHKGVIRPKLFDAGPDVNTLSGMSRSRKVFTSYM
jgi:hypothetical protein